MKKSAFVLCITKTPPWIHVKEFREFLHISPQLLSSLCTTSSQTSFAEVKVAGDSETEPTPCECCSFIAYRKSSEQVIKFPRYAIAVWTETA